MISARAFSAKLACLLALTAASASAEDVEAWKWERAEASAGAYSLEVPCSAEQMASDVKAQMMAAIMTLENGTSVSCLRAGMMLVAGQITMPEAEILAETAFDTIRQEGDGEAAEGVVKGERTFDGRRALVSKEANEAVSAQTAIIELDRRTILMVIGSGPMEEGVTVEQAGHILDRYFGSLEVAQ